MVVVVVDNISMNRFQFIVMALVLLLGAFIFSKHSRINEGFSSVNGRCGLNLPPCPAGTKCMNGYCQTYTPPVQPKMTELSLLP